MRDSCQNPTKVICALLGALVGMLFSNPVLALQPSELLLVWNSASTESSQIRDAYIAAYPEVMEFDLNDPTLVVDRLSYAEFDTKVREPLAAYIDTNFVTLVDGLRHVTGLRAMATTRGLPGEISGTDEFTGGFVSTFASFESELSLVMYDLRPTGTEPDKDIGPIRNPWYTETGIDFSSTTLVVVNSLAAISSPSNKLAQQFVPLANTSHRHAVFPVCRLDGPQLNGVSGVENAIAMIERTSQPITVPVCGVRALFDELPTSTGADLDFNGDPPVYPAIDDFDSTVNYLDQLLLAGASSSMETFLDSTLDFIDGQDAVAQETPLIAYGSFGENHDINGSNGEDPPGVGVYLRSFDNFHPAAVFLSYESFNGNSVVAGGIRGGQQQALDFIGLGGSFTIAHVREPTTIFVAKFRWLLENFYEHNLTFAEAAFASIPGVSWQSTPVGNPLARLDLVPFGNADVNGDGVANVEDIYHFTASPVDFDCSGSANIFDRAALEAFLRSNEIEDA
ncbi:MAG: hypothetical protein AAGB34_08010, partial [Planctomycetota bacterium]